MVEMVDVKTNYSDSIKYSIELFRVNIMVVTKELLKSSNVPYIGSVPIFSEDYINKSKNSTQEKNENIMFL